MRKSLVTLVALSVITQLLASVDHNCPPIGSQRTASGLNRFATSLYQVATESVRPHENFVISPFSIYNGVTMCLAGSKGNTAKQIRNGLHIKSSCKRHASASVGNLTYKILKNNNETLMSANRLFVANGYALRAKFKQLLAQRFDAEIENVNFGQENTRSQINEWVESKTSNKIKDLIPAGALSSLTKLAIVNAAYFKSQWQNRFNASETQMGHFYGEGSAIVLSVPMMRIRASLQVANLPELNCRVLELPYSEHKLSMLIVLPNQRRGLRALETRAMFNKVLNAFDDRMVNMTLEVVIPKFKIDGSLALETAMKKVGMTDLFDKKRADLSGISPKNDLHVSDVFHKASIEIDETGAEAAATTGMVFMFRSFRSQPDPFIADRPFMFFIRDNASRLVLFAGRVANPSTQ